MSSHHNSHFQPPPPIRTSTADSQSSGTMSPSSPDMLSPTSTYSRGGRGAASPTEESFFGAITSRMRGRSRSRSRSGDHRKRSKSPMVMPPEQFPPSSTARPMSATYAPVRPQHDRHVSTSSQHSTASIKPTRPSLQGPQRRSTSGSDPWHGRHSNSWLFNDFSVREHAKDLLHMGRKPSA
ncbi:hypothetical protein BU26DRAFT_516751 [Trematosphaeria pertusa]|uniref:Uncharacterized protein n=1 Tax=Trematosphaeria pertusa TaxID=390896 RepID=A0A6A6IQJ1_9PLEO|nr:uncharacterized protein BU26DRAFT_516751 [Trematosphaeria pertusa]KAF2252042.1 hypothetical protein BU26DRAFT_516751 [Trematosphaeria pertusa]